eukprot:TRINITY_DN40285_c0_g1_i1.p1 TRINITY_DN40285_c0_g1~~TRINITY_DN40285_c0_g1_i1.p1  ORF type:complete len:171 (-),score=51.10 TRINITY_DN40285_c0_g1_i1:198-710(-)
MPRPPAASKKKRGGQRKKKMMGSRKSQEKVKKLHKEKKSRSGPSGWPSFNTRVATERQEYLAFVERRKLMKDAETQTDDVPLPPLQKLQAEKKEQRQQMQMKSPQQQQVKSHQKQPSKPQKCTRQFLGQKLNKKIIDDPLRPGHELFRRIVWELDAPRRARSTMKRSWQR